MVGVLTERVEAAATCHDTRLIGGHALQNFLFGLEHLVGGQQIGFPADLYLVVVRLALEHTDAQRALELGPPRVAAALQLLNLIDGEMVFLLQGLDERLVVIWNIQFLGQFTANGTTATAKFAVNRDDKFLV